VVIPNSSRLIKPWSQQNAILFLNIQSSSKIVWFEMLGSKSPNP